MRRLIAALGIVALFVAGCQRESSGDARATSRSIHSPEPHSLPRTYVVFADVTRSLSEAENESVRKNVQRIVDVLPPKATLVVFPILEDVERAAAVYSATLPDVQSTGDSVDFTVIKNRSKKEAADALMAITGGPAAGRNRTCISGALRKAEDFAVDATDVRPVEIIIVSDMLEDCEDSLLGRKLSLEKRSIDKELRAVRALPPEALLRLNGANVTVLLPTVPTSPAETKRPAAHHLEAFWREILDRSGDRKESFRFSTEMPRRLTELSVEAKGGL